MWFAYIILGFIAGVLAGFFGIGGGIILIPALVFIFGFTQHAAQGTTLAAMVPPIGLLAALQYYYKGNVRISAALFICVGFFIGGWLGGFSVNSIPEPALKKLFGIFLLVVSLQMLIGK